ncbi:hypothetical protein EIN_227690 [Entamoeba invadens IP1]|uniref:Uncharacterized protein n=1 Tax=Entamoeba invadens IP1 TaxID=370355 RepID=A0A0A1U2P6_ENTIV|nr:hypothetical protein EIN_227690 [Entamoeba invadens IP1]ELP88346.1 hypothetical protein EIN_227690 [Entamoeba invadens IP1]|eukprot:XP_004255117.1 hypothetical protein EIN_227690 [Entamoeba invadens IP1]
MSSRKSLAFQEMTKPNNRLKEKRDTQLKDTQPLRKEMEMDDPFVEDAEVRPSIRKSAIPLDKKETPNWVTGEGKVSGLEILKGLTTQQLVISNEAEIVLDKSDSQKTIIAEPGDTAKRIKSVDFPHVERKQKTHIIQEQKMEEEILDKEKVNNDIAENEFQMEEESLTASMIPFPTEDVVQKIEENIPKRETQKDQLSLRKDLATQPKINATTKIVIPQMTCHKVLPPSYQSDLIRQDPDIYFQLNMNNVYKKKGDADKQTQPNMEPLKNKGNVPSPVQTPFQKSLEGSSLQERINTRKNNSCSTHTTPSFTRTSSCGNGPNVVPKKSTTLPNF